MELSSKDQNKDRKLVFRRGVPDSQKRKLLLDVFQLLPGSCDMEYDVVKKSCTQDFLQFTQEVQVVSDSLSYDILTKEGKAELEFMLMYIN